MSPEQHWEWQQKIALAAQKIEQARVDAMEELLVTSFVNDAHRAFKKQALNQKIHWLRVLRRQLIQEYHYARMK